MEKFTREQLNSMDKDALVTLVMSCMDRIRQLTNENAEQTRELNHKIDNLTETIALLTQRSFGKKSEVKLYSGDQLTIKIDAQNGLEREDQVQQHSAKLLQEESRENLKSKKLLSRNTREPSAKVSPRKTLPACRSPLSIMYWMRKG